MVITAETASGLFCCFEAIISESTQPIFANFSGLVAFLAWMIAVKLSCDRLRDLSDPHLFSPRNISEMDESADFAC